MSLNNPLGFTFWVLITSILLGAASKLPSLVKSFYKRPRRGKDLRKKRLGDVVLKSRDFLDCNFSGVEMGYAELRSCDLTGSVFANADLHNARINRCDLSNVDFRGADLSFATFYNCYLAGAQFDGADLEGTDFAGSRLGGAKLQGARLRRTTFFEANLDGLDVSFIDLRGAQLSSDALIRVENMHLAKGPWREATFSPPPAHMETEGGLLVPKWDDSLASYLASKGCDLDVAKSIFLAKRTSISLDQLIDVTRRLGAANAPTAQLSGNDA